MFAYRTGLLSVVLVEGYEHKSPKIIL